MKILVKICAVGMCVLSCSKEVPVQIESFATKNGEFVVHTPGELADFSAKTYSPLEFIDFIGGAYDDYLSFLLTEKCNIIIKHALAVSFETNRSSLDSLVAKELDCSYGMARFGWNIKRYNYSYWSTSYQGEPIELSAVLCVPSLVNKDGHAISAMSLCPPHYPLDPDVCPSNSGSVLLSRTVFNHAVVCPDYEGRGVTKDNPYSSFETMDHAIQAIDAAIAARALLEQEGYNFDDDFGLYNIGVSEGGGTSYAIHYLIENSGVDYSNLNLKLSFCANGLYRHEFMMREDMKNFRFDDPLFFEEMMYDYSEMFKCIPDSAKGEYSPEDFLKGEFMKEDWTVDIEHPLVEAFCKAMADNDITESWEPQCTLALAGNHDDDVMLYNQQPQYVVDLIGQSSNFVLMDFSTPHSKFLGNYLGPEFELAHNMADVYCFIHAVSYEDPTNHEIFDFSFDE